MRNVLAITALAAAATTLMSLGPAQSQDRATLEIVSPIAGSVIELGNDSEKAIGVLVKSNFTLLSEGKCGDNRQCGHIHMKIDPEGETCNIPGRPYNSMNSDFGGDLIKARFGHCPEPVGKHVIGVLLADDHHKPILVDGKPVTALVTVTTK